MQALYKREYKNLKDPYSLITTTIIMNAVTLTPTATANSNECCLLYLRHAHTNCTAHLGLKYQLHCLSG